MALRRITLGATGARDRLNQLLPRYCTAEITRHGRVVVYFRKVGETGRIRMRAEPTTPEFYQEYAGLLHDGAGRDAVPRAAPSGSLPKSWRWLCERYLESDHYRSLASVGQRVRRRQLESTYEEPTRPGSQVAFGDCPLSKFNARAVRVLRDRKVAWIDGEGRGNIRTNIEAANSRLKYIRGVLSYAKEEYPELVERNWARDVDYLRSASDGHSTWSLEEIAQFERHHPIGTKARLTFALALLTGQRRGDLARLGRCHERNGMLVVRQEKNEWRNPITAYVPILPPLRRIIASSPVGDIFYIVQNNRQPYRKESLSNLFRKWCAEAGLEGRSLHGLRKACVVRLIMENATPHQIMAITGHQTLKEIDRYARKYLREQAAGEVLTGWLKRYGASG